MPISSSPARSCGGPILRRYAPFCSWKSRRGEKWSGANLAGGARGVRPLVARRRDRDGSGPARRSVPPDEPTSSSRRRCDCSVRSGQCVFAVGMPSADATFSPFSGLCGARLLVPGGVISTSARLGAGGAHKRRDAGSAHYRMVASGSRPISPCRRRTTDDFFVERIPGARRCWISSAPTARDREHAPDRARASAVLRV